MAGTTPSVPEPAPSGGLVHDGAAPRFRRTVRSVAITGALLFLGLLVFLTTRYSRGIEPAAAGEAARPPASSRPLSAERIERYARERLEEELRARARPPEPPKLVASPPEAASETSGRTAERSLRFGSAGPGISGGGTRAAGPAGRRLSAIRSGLIPAGALAGTGAGTGAGARFGSGAGLGGGSAAPGRPEVPAAAPPLPGLEELRRSLASISEAPPGTSAPRPRRRSGPAGGGTVELPEERVHRLTRLPAPAVPDRLYAGTVVPLVLAHDVATDVPGPVRAVVARDVYDSFSHRRLLIPRGTLVLGHQAAYAAGGDERVLIAWRELKLPSGETLLLPESPAGSRDGSAGVRGRVDQHWWSRFGSAAALSLVGAGVQLAQPQRRTAVGGFAPSEGQILAQQLGLELGRLGQEILRRGVDRPPTITLEAGQSLSLLVTAELAFPY